jgi:deoxyribonuclease V
MSNDKEHILPGAPDMKVHHLHEWDLDTEEATELQKDLREQVEFKDAPDHVRLVAGADCGFDRDREKLFSAVVLYDLEREEVVEKRTGVEELSFPYIPGLLSFREMPGLLPRFDELSERPDAVISDGHGYAHPRRFGLACHLGLFLEVPTAGCAKSCLVGEYEPQEKVRGTFTPLEADGERIGQVLCTRDGVKPVFVSPGHRITMKAARELVLNSGAGYKLPEPQRQADLAVRRAKEDCFAS